jgi:hypothetical protein
MRAPSHIPAHRWCEDDRLRCVGSTPQFVDLCDHIHHLYELSRSRAVSTHLYLKNVI